MSRIGKKPVAIPAGVKVSVNAGIVTVEGKSKLTLPIPPQVEVAVEGEAVVVTRKDDTRSSNAMQGLARSLINNMSSASPRASRRSSPLSASVTRRRRRAARSR